MLKKKKTDNKQKKSYVKNAKKVIYDGIEFKSKLEVAVYKRIKEYGVEPQYEGHKYIIMQGFKPTKNFYSKDKNKKDSNLEPKQKKVLDITYTPDFQFYYHHKLIIIESKGFVQEKYELKRKMFRKMMEDMGDVYFFEVYNLRHLDQAMDIISRL